MGIRNRNFVAFFLLNASLSLLGCASEPGPDLTPKIEINSGKSFSQISRTHRDPYFEELVRAGGHDPQVIENHLSLKLAQIVNGFQIARNALGEFDQRVKKSSTGNFIATTNDPALLSRLEGADTYRAIANEQLVSDILFLESLADGTTSSSDDTSLTSMPTSVPTSTLSLTPTSSPSVNASASETINWLVQRGQQLTPEQHLALQPFAEELNALAPNPASISKIHDAFFLSKDRLVAIERNSDVQKSLARNGESALAHADQELKNWISHFAKARLDAQNEFEYYPTVVGRKHRTSLRMIASESPLSSASARAANSASRHEKPLRPLTARALNENEFVLIYSGKLRSSASLRLISDLNRQKRSATFFLDSEDLASAQKSEYWPAGLQSSTNLTFATQGNSETPPCLQGNGELERSMVLGRSTLENLSLPVAPFLRPGFDAESGRVGKIAHGQHLRLVRTNIASFDQIDFDARRIAERVATQISKLKSGLIEFHANSPRSSEIEAALGQLVDENFHKSKSAPRFVALSSKLGEE